MNKYMNMDIDMDIHGHGLGHGLGHGHRHGMGTNTGTDMGTQTWTRTPGIGMDTGHGNTCHAHVDEETWSVHRFEDVESMKQLFAFKLVYLSDG
jgi:hypothetical protein